MKKLKRFGIIALALLLSILALEVAERPVTGLFNLVPEAHAVVGRPLTPVSVAGVTRRTVRRCAVGVYNCQLSNDPFLLAALPQPKAIFQF
ncbi:MAG TPA: hypothetical protein VK885_01010 [Desulfotignum sp.]|jgi:hypothetical protein|nr:hypothetical protein [Desulfotignum sp.]